LAGTFNQAGNKDDLYTA